ncbi:prtrc system protein e [Flavobacterium sp. Sd200]|uniref:prtrc system protein e n=1 Tax=Flavobacterium sp. Sd200 TaxID=2692211 RepID=UPI00136EE15A|nr:prtrc system protein e [Flavobacterium sp. Sd200]MXN90810.1 prtrc system protein e [Flavobacterium sp. Sd200]
MEANFFRQLANIDFAGSVQVTIAHGIQGSLIVSVLVRNEGCSDTAKNLIRPMTMRGTAEQMDTQFFEYIAMPVEAASGLMVNMEDYMQHLDQVKKQSAMEKEKGTKEKKETDAKEKKYREAIDKSQELEREGKFREAYSKVPNPNDHPEHTQEIKERRAALSSRFDEGGLFDERIIENVEP